MSAELLLGAPCADEIIENVRKEMQGKNAALYTVGFDDPKWKQYTQSLSRSASKCGITTSNVFLHDGAPYWDLCETVRKACDKPDAVGVLVQQPLPKLYNEALNCIDRSVDVDCLSSLSVAALYKGESGLRPATPSAVIRLLEFYGISVSGKRVVVVGRGNAVGKPLALMLLAKDATVTVCHTKTVNLAQICASADILVSACGSPNLITCDFVTPVTVVVDVGLSFVGNKCCGDVQPSVYEKCKAATPVPGGVGPVTRAVLLENMLKAYLAK